MLYSIAQNVFICLWLLFMPRVESTSTINPTEYFLTTGLSPVDVAFSPDGTFFRFFFEFKQDIHSSRNLGPGHFVIMR